jgi:flavin reductase (DIM6/NTAB) family NADH-FMN oxidoreductase RutF
MPPAPPASSTPSGVDPAQFRQLLGRFATGVTVLTTRDARGRPIGMTASSVASVSLEPPLLLVSVSREHDMHPALQQAQRFVLNVLAADQEALSRRFAADHPDRFEGIGYRETKHGIPVLDGALASIECEKHAEVPGGDHTVFFGLVTGGSVTERRPLLYYCGGYAELGGGG